MIQSNASSWRWRRHILLDDGLCHLLSDVYWRLVGWVHSIVRMCSNIWHRLSWRVVRDLSISTWDVRGVLGWLLRLLRLLRLLGWHWRTTHFGCILKVNIKTCHPMARRCILGVC